MAKATATIVVKDLPEVRDLMRRARERIDVLESIVRAVAAAEPMAYCPGDEMSGDWYECGFCEVQADAKSRYGEWVDVEHAESCEWRRARDWLRGIPVVSDPDDEHGPSRVTPSDQGKRSQSGA